MGGGTFITRKSNSVHKMVKWSDKVYTFLRDYKFINFETTSSRILEIVN